MFTVDYKGVNKKTKQQNLEKKLEKKKVEPLSKENFLNIHVRYFQCFKPQRKYWAQILH